MKITVFGEILWDIFGDDKKIGGAPFNFAAHALKQGADVELISAIGDDELGRAAIAECSRLSIPVDKICITDKPTGFCQVTLKDGTPQYDLRRDVAYDYIRYAPEAGQDTKPDIQSADAGGSETESDSKAENGGSKCDSGPRYFYFGTLAQRSEVSRSTLNSILDRVHFDEIFLDINIRQNFYSNELIDSSIRKATILKVSREEIGVIDVTGSPEEKAKEILARYPGLKMVIVTLDSDGALVCTGDGRVFHADVPECKVVSTVGAGDSFSAGFLVRYGSGRSINECLEGASRTASFVCEHIEAVPDYSLFESL